MKTWERYTGEADCEACGRYFTKGIRTNFYSTSDAKVAYFCRYCIAYFIDYLDNQLPRAAAPRAG